MNFTSSAATSGVMCDNTMVYTVLDPSDRSSGNKVKAQAKRRKKLAKITDTYNHDEPSRRFFLRDIPRKEDSEATLALFLRSIPQSIVKSQIN